MTVPTAGARGGPGGWIDLHIDTLRHAPEQAAGLLTGWSGSHVDVPRLRQAGVGVAVWAACDDQLRGGPESTARVLTMLAAGRDLVARGAGALRLVRSGEDLAACLAGEAHGILFGIEGAHALAGSLSLLDAFHALGVRVLTLTWNHANPFAQGCRLAGEADGGLRPLGRELLGRAQSLGIVVDLAHASARTLREALPYLQRPFLVSHTACRALREHPRNLSDEQLRAVAAQGGVVGITFCPAFLAEPGEAVTRATVVAHVRHALAVAGPDAVGLGSDFDGVPALPEGMPGCEALPALRDDLSRAGIPASIVEQVTTGNAQRVLRGALGES